jgi:hypothetical protein
VPETERRYVTISPDLKTAAGFDTAEGAEAAAVAFGDGAHVVDTESSSYHPSVMKVEQGALGLVGYGSLDARMGLDANLMEAAKKGYPALVRAYLARGADAASKDARGGTALHWAAAGGNAEVVKLLLEAGAGAQAADGKGVTPLEVAERKNRPELVEMLRQVPN